MAPSVSILTVFDCTYCLVTERRNSYINYIVGMCGPNEVWFIKALFFGLVPFKQVKEITAN